MKTEPTVMSHGNSATPKAARSSSATPIVAEGVLEEDDALPGERLSDEEAVLRRAAAELAERKAQLRAATLLDLVRAQGEDSLDELTKSLNDGSATVRAAAIRALYELDPDFATSFVNQALREGTREQRRRLGAALNGSGLAGEVSEGLDGEESGNSYAAFSVLFLLAKAGEVEPLTALIEGHANIRLRLALIKMLATSGEPAVAPAFHRLLLKERSPSEVRSALMEALVHLSQNKGRQE